jgi:hypothetical protein
MIRIIFISMVFLILQVVPSLLLASNGQTGDTHYTQRESRKDHNDHDEEHRRVEEKDSEGNELTGQAAAWLLVSANLTVLFSLLLKGANRFLPLKPQTKSSIKAFNQFQKKYLMRFHFLLNPIALCVAFLHFLLSSCRISPLPEWGLLLVTMMVALGVVLKFKVAPGWLRRVIYRLHTTPATSSMVILLLVVGHLVVD